tara:strand:+ start:49 stop:816 length:768 start_codon:yes stop_codon:yes gene_type:complete
MWFPCDEIKELNLDLPVQLGIHINFLKIRKTTINEEISDISNLNFIDLEEIKKFKTKKRSEEHATGRYLLYHMFKKYYPFLNSNKIRVSRDENRAPYFEWNDKNNELLPNFSISTTDDLAIVAICNSNLSLGIDIEKSNQKRSNNLFDFVSEGLELDQIKRLYKLENNIGINKIWTVKESILKCLRLGMSISPTKIKVLDENQKYRKTIIFDGNDISSENFLLKLSEDYSLSLAYQKIEPKKFLRMRIAGIEPTT